jgi:hypothetical protein
VTGTLAPIVDAIEALYAIVHFLTVLALASCGLSLASFIVAWRARAAARRR